MDGSLHAPLSSFSGGLVFFVIIQGITISFYDPRAPLPSVTSCLVWIPLSLLRIAQGSLIPPGLESMREFCFGDLLVAVFCLEAFQ
jgi:hypothetical protein